jgi:hypothetical protein
LCLLLLCIWNFSKISSILPFGAILNMSMISSMGPYSCPCSAYFYFVKLNLIL